MATKGLRILLVCALAATVLAASRPCKKFVCKDPVDPANPQVCAELEKRSDTVWIEYVGTCESTKTCVISEVDERTQKCVDNPEFFKYPGQLCNSPTACHGKLVDGYCRGKGQGESCENHWECDVGLMCGIDWKCEPAGEEGDRCGAEHLLCQSYLYCKEGSCVKYGCVSNDDPAGRAGADICASHYTDSHGVCREGPTLNTPIFVESTDNLCVYSNQEETHAVCGFHEDGLAICKPGAATLLSEWKELLSYLNLKPKCHPYFSDMAQCDYAINEMNERLYYRGRIAYYHLHHFTQIQKVPECLQKFVNPDYFGLLGKYNDASTLSVLLAALITVLFVLLQQTVN